MNQCQACEEPTTATICRECRDGSPRKPRRVRKGAAVFALVVLLPSAAIAFVSPRAEVAGEVTVAGAAIPAAPEMLPDVETQLEEVTTTTTSTTTSTTTLPIPEPATTTTTLAPVAAPPQTPPRPRPPTTTTTTLPPAPAVPNVIGLDEGIATAALTSAGFAVNVSYRVAPNAAGVVLGQSGGADGTTVSLVIGEAPPEPPPEDPEPEEAP